jgi:hypothetical protein
VRFTTGALGAPVVVTVTDDPAPPRIELRWGRTRSTMSESEAVTLATRLVEVRGRWTDRSSPRRANLNVRIGMR